MLMKWLEAESPKQPVLERESDYPPMAVSLTNTLVNKTGSWRIFRPVYENKIPPCNAECPAHEKIQGYLALVEQGQYVEAYQLIVEDNPFPAITGRVCYHPCEGVCNRRDFDEALAIHDVERFVGDYGAAHAPAPKPAVRRPESVAIVGSGPAGMTAAYYLALKGFPVTIFESGSKPGGMLRVGIPGYRLPEQVLNREFRRLKKLGVRIRLKIRVGKDVRLSELRQKYQFVILAYGAHQSRKLGIAGEDSVGVISGLDFLEQINCGTRPRVGRRVVVVGGGNTAIDAARCALRLGADVRVIYRRTRAEMPAIAEEVDAALAEGVAIDFLIAPSRIITSKGRVTGLECLRMKLGKPDESGRRRPVPVKNSEFRLKLDTVIAAIGEQVDLALLDTEIDNTGWAVKADFWGRTDVAGVYACGDCVTGPKTVVEAIATGKRVADAIDSIVTQRRLTLPPEQKIVRYVDLNTSYFERASRVPVRELDSAIRGRNFQEIRSRYSKSEAAEEAARCLSCGVCDRCDNCYVFCPDIAVLKTTEGYEYDYDFCKGCGVCAKECPRDAITMVEERRASETIL